MPRWEGVWLLDGSPEVGAALAHLNGAVALARHAECEQEPHIRVEILLALADTYETQLGDATQAMAAYQRALDTDEHCIDAINALERLYRRTQAWDRLVDVLTKKSQVVNDTDRNFWIGAEDAVAYGLISRIVSRSDEL